MRARRPGCILLGVRSQVAAALPSSASRILLLRACVPTQHLRRLASHCQGTLLFCDCCYCDSNLEHETTRTAFIDHQLPTVPTPQRLNILMYPHRPPAPEHHTLILDERRPHSKKLQWKKTVGNLIAAGRIASTPSATTDSGRKRRKKTVGFAAGVKESSTKHPLPIPRSYRR